MRLRPYVLLSLVLLAASVGPRTARGQTGSVALEATGGFAIPVGELAEVHATGPAASFSVVFRANRRLSPLLHLGFTAFREPDHRDVWRYHLGLRYEWIRPAETPFVLSTDFTAGATLVGDTNLFSVGPGSVTREDLFDDGPSLRGTVRAGYQIGSSWRLFAEAGTVAVLTQADDVRLRTGDRVEALGPTLAVPISVGVRLSP